MPFESTGIRPVAIVPSIVPNGWIEDPVEKRMLPVIHIGMGRPTIAVRLFNPSHNPVKIYREQCSYGFENLTLEISAQSDEVALGQKITPIPFDQALVVSRAAAGWGGNGPVTTIIPANESIDRLMWLGSEEQTDLGPSAYSNFPELKGSFYYLLRMRAVFKNDDLTSAPGVWGGKAASAFADFLVTKGP